MPGVLTVSRCEVRKLVAQKRTYLGLAAAVGAPLLFVTALALRNGAPTDAPFGASVRSSGLAILLLIAIAGLRRTRRSPAHRPKRPKREPFDRRKPSRAISATALGK